ncbi:MAG: DUF4339 domain-containing protein [Candidatus Methylacidiphilales bacterium]|nr:DUF4339 domain-containing protein [Candidatus Methylacidiphilales bacterium]
MKRYFYADKNNNPKGPVTGDDLTELRRNGQVNDKTRVFEEGATEWQSLGKVIPREAGDIDSQATPPGVTRKTGCIGLIALPAVGWLVFSLLF